MANYQSIFTGQQIDERLSAVPNKVDKVTGKGLSTNDYTSEDKTKLTGIEAGAEVNAIEGVKRNGVELTPDASRKVNVTVPTKTSDLTNDSGFLTQHQSLSAYRTSADQDTIDAGKQNAPATAGTAGQVLGLNSSLQPIWKNVEGGASYTAGNGINIADNAISVKAKANGGIIVDADGVSAEKQVFFAIYDSTTYAEVMAALQAGKLCIAQMSEVQEDGELLLTDYNSTDGIYTFSSVVNEQVREVTLDDNDTWATTTKDIYSKPSGGIPSTDLASAVQTSLGKADSAVQPASLATVATSGDYDDLSNKPTIPVVTGKADKVASATNGNFAGLNASGNLTDSGYDASDFATPTSEVAVASSVASQELSPNTLYHFASRSTALTITLGTAISGIENEYNFTLIADGTTAPTITWSIVGLTWKGGSAPTITAGKTYEVSILKVDSAYYGVFVEY